MTHIAIIFTNFGPYHLARLKALSSHCQDLGWSFTGIELARAETDYAWQVTLDHLPFNTISVVPDQSLEAVSFPQLGLRLWCVLNELQPDVMAIAGYARPAMLAALFWSRQHRRPAILMSETTERALSVPPSEKGLSEPW